MDTYTERLIEKIAGVEMEPEAVAASGYTNGNGHAKKPAPGFTFITLADLYLRPDPAYNFVVDDLLPVSGSSILVAKPKVGKSTLAQQLARSVAAGTPFLDRGCAQGTVLYMAFEEKDSEVKTSFKAAGAPAEMPVVFHFGDVPEDRMTALRAAIEIYSPALIVLDTLAYWMGVVDFNDYSQVGAAMRPLHLLARATQTHIMTVHHAGKGGGGIDSPLGSTALTGNVDTVVWLQDTDGGRLIETRQRYGPQMPKTVLAFERKTRTLAMTGTVSEAHQHALKEKIVEILLGRCMTETDLRDTLRADKAHMLIALNELVAAKRIVRSGRGARNSPYMYELAPATGDAPS